MGIQSILVYSNCAIPLKSIGKRIEAIKADILSNTKPRRTELDIVYKKYNNPEFESHLNVPFRIAIMRSLIVFKSWEVIIIPLLSHPMLSFEIL
jgi:hypothetical protein